MLTQMVIFHALFQINVIFIIKVGNAGILLEIVVISNSVTVQNFDQSIKRVKKSSFLQWTVNIYHCAQMPEIASLQICG